MKRLNSLFERLVENPLVRRVLRNSAYLFSASGFAVVASFFQNLLATRLLGVYYLGVLGAIVKFTSVVNKLISFRMNELVVRYVGKYMEEDDIPRAAAIFKAAGLVEIVSSVIAYGLLFLLAPLGAKWFAKDVALTSWFTLYGLVVLANLMYESSTGLLQILDRFRGIAVVQVGQAVVTLVLITWAYFNGGGLFEVLLSYMAGKVVQAVGVVFLALRAAHRAWGSGWWRTSLGLIWPERRELIRFAVSTNISATINLVNKDSEELWVSFFRGPVEAGYYKQALALSNLVLLPVAPLPQATYPELTREVSKHNWTNVRYVLRQGTRLALGYTGPMVLGLILFGRPLIGWLYEPEFLPAYPALVILLGGFLVANAYYWNRAALLALDLPHYPTRVNLLAAVLKVGLAILLVPRFGYLASAGLLTGYYLLSIGLNVRRASKELRKREAASMAGGEARAEPA